MTQSKWRAPLADIMASLTPDANFTYPIRHGTMRAGVYAPTTIDDQTPHSQDELYLVTTGSGWFERGADRVGFAAGDMLFVPAGMAHRFTDFTADFATWVVFWGPKGGEG